MIDHVCQVFLFNASISGWFSGWLFVVFHSSCIYRMTHAFLFSEFIKNTFPDALHFVAISQASCDFCVNCGTLLLDIQELVNKFCTFSLKL